MKNIRTLTDNQNAAYIFITKILNSKRKSKGDFFYTKGDLYKEITPEQAEELYNKFRDKNILNKFRSIQSRKTKSLFEPNLAKEALNFVAEISYQLKNPPPIETDTLFETIQRICEIYTFIERMNTESAIQLYILSIISKKDPSFFANTPETEDNKKKPMAKEIRETLKKFEEDYRKAAKEYQTNKNKKGYTQR